MLQPETERSGSTDSATSIMEHLWHRGMPRQCNKLPKIYENGYSAVRSRKLRSHACIEGIKSVNNADQRD